MISLAVVEDEEFTREVSVERLEARFGMASSVEAFGSVEELIESGRRFDVVVLDLSLDEGAIQHGDAVRLVASMTRVVVFSGRQAKEAVDRVFAAGALGYVCKDSAHAADSLATAIHKALDGERFVDEETAARIQAPRRRPLTVRQQDVLRLEALGRTTGQIARELQMTEAGVRRHVERIIEIYPECAKQAERVRLAVRLGLVGESERYRPPSPGR